MSLIVRNLCLVDLFVIFSFFSFWAILFSRFSSSSFLVIYLVVQLKYDVDRNGRIKMSFRNWDAIFLSVFFFVFKKNDIEISFCDKYEIRLFFIFDLSPKFE